MVFLTLLLVAGFAALVELDLLAPPRSEPVDPADLVVANSRARRWTDERLGRLELMARSLADTRPVRELVARPRDADADGADLLRADVRTVLASPRRGVGEGLGAVLDRDGTVVVASLDGRPAAADVLSGLEAPTAAWVGLRRLRDTLYAVAVEPVVGDRFEDAGWVVAGLPLGAADADARPAGGEAVWLARGSDGELSGDGAILESAVLDSTVLDSTMEPAATRRLLAMVADGVGDWDGAGDLDVEGLDWDGNPHRAFYAPLETAPRTALLLLGPDGAETARVFPHWLLLGVPAALALLLAAVLATWVGAGARRPARALASRLEALREHPQDLAPVADSLRRQRGFLKPVAQTWARWLEDLESRRRVRRRLARLEAPVSASPAGGEDAEPRERTLAVFELRHHARRSDRPVERFDRDVERVREAVRGRGGRLETALGHRLLVTFSDGSADRRRLAALGAVAEALRRLALPEPGVVADETAEPPVVAITDGAVTRTGSRRLGSADRRRFPVVVGLPVQELESLAREGAPGQVVLSARLARAVAEPFAAAGVALEPQSGLLSPRPVYVLERDDLATVALRSEGPRVLPPPEAGDLLGERFEIRRVVGRGPLGTVYEVRDRQADRTVALKLLDVTPEPTADAPAWDGLDSPLRGLPSVAHDSLARVYEYGRLEGPQRFRYLTRRLTPGICWRFLDGLAGPERWDLTRQLAVALAALHEQDLFHGRLHGGNVFVEPGGRLVLTDFGLAPWAPPARDPGSVDDDPRGRCLAPEQEDGSPGDARSDVYAWGLLVTDLYESAGADSDEDTAGLPEALRRVRDRALAPDPAERPLDGGELAEAVLELRRADAAPPW